ncbi:MAG: FAD-dependent oxidoreductase [Actinomycetota bacterium]|nr:FAD-dependent oxidoreductase [Actinomycetota bacterium]MDD5668299.1 FAD-dependent oxidoreductase [Actinomycetota bacterium]
MRAEIKNKVEVAENTLQVDYDLRGELIEFKPGQFFVVDLIDPPYEDERGSRRHFSIVNSPNEKETITMVTRLRDSAFKRSLREMPTGSEVEIGKIGGDDFTLPEDTARPLAFIAGGIGIAPFMSMIRYEMEEGLGFRIVLFYSNRKRQAAPFLEELGERASGNDRLELVITMTDDPSWEGETGRIDGEFLEAHLQDPASYTFYVAGPPEMNKAVSAEVEKLGVDKEFIMASDFAGY